MLDTRNFLLDSLDEVALLLATADGFAPTPGEPRSEAWTMFRVLLLAIKDVGPRKGITINNLVALAAKEIRFDDKMEDRENGVAEEEEEEEEEEGPWLPRNRLTEYFEERGDETCGTI